MNDSQVCNTVRAVAAIAAVAGIAAGGLLFGGDCARCEARDAAAAEAARPFEFSEVQYPEGWGNLAACELTDRASGDRYLVTLNGVTKLSESALKITHPYIELHSR